MSKSLFSHALAGALISLGLLAGPQAFATQFVPEEYDDLFSDGKCKGSETLPYGNEIYQWPSKYDAVYWPHTAPQFWFRVCPKSGFVSFPYDFRVIYQEGAPEIASWLEANYTAHGDDLELDEILYLAEKIYEVRGMDAEFWTWYRRLQAYWADEAGDAEKARHYRELALPLMEAELQQLKPGVYRAQILFVVGDYYRRFGDLDKMETYFQRAEKVEWLDDDGKEQVGSDYINEMIAERRKLVAGEAPE